ncbi:MAG: aminotransferase class I/II-fold pyridoxal phosphate-dependent enzyme [Candidatus Bipolaricaulia bacterium]
MTRPILTGAIGPHAWFNGKEILYFGGNNYLGIAGRPELAAAAASAIRRYGASVGASRETSGTSDLHLQLEQRLAAWKDTEDVCVYASGYLGNLILLRALLNPDDTVICDRGVHPSVLDGIPRSIKAVHFYEHHDMDDLKRVIQKVKQGIVIVNGVETVSGEIAPLDRILEIVFDRRFRVVVDDAHATGVLGENGRGTPEHFGINSPHVYQTETMSKALGSFGGFISSNRQLCDRIRQVSAYIGSTTLPPSVVGASIASVETLMKEPQLRERLKANAQYMASRLNDLGLTVRWHGTPIVSFDEAYGDTGEKIHKILLEHSILVPLIRYPTADSPGRLRLTVSAGHSKEDIDRFYDIVKRYG